ncbi:hypothetical protein TMatcc_006241 [Talaromyces marneffei ATCC 18224]
MGHMIRWMRDMAEMAQGCQTAAESDRQRCSVVSDAMQGTTIGDTPALKRRDDHRWAGRKSRKSMETQQSQVREGHREDRKRKRKD